MKNYPRSFITPRRLLKMIGVLVTLTAASAFEVSDYNVVYDQPATNGSAHSMPLGNGSVGLNAWIESDGTLSLYVSHTDSLDVDGHLIKVGKTHFRPSINPLEGGDKPFRQVLHLEDGTMRASAGEPGKEIRYKLWVDAYTEVVHVEMEGDQAFALRAENDPWRAKEYTRAKNYTDFAPAIPGSDPAMIAKKPDTILSHTKSTIGWYTDTGDNPAVEKQMKHQGLDYDESEDILKHRVFGALIASSSAKAKDDMSLVTAPGKKHHYMIHVKVLWPATPKEWETAIVKQLKSYHKATGSDPDKTFPAHEKYWQDFWKRSWVEFTSRSAISDMEKDDAYVTTRAYNLQRYMTACMGRGRDTPMQFNGGIFTYDSVHIKGRANVPQTGDYCSHGPSQWWQNTRFPYIGLCAAGDTEFMRGMIDIYGKRHRKFGLQRAKRYAGVNGLILPETLVPWGAIDYFVFGGTSYEQRGGKPNEKMFEWNSYLKKHFNNTLETAWYMLDYADHTGDTKTAREIIIPFTSDSLRFFHEYYSKNDENGKILMENANALETFWNVTNPAHDIAGIRALCERLLANHQGNAKPEDIQLWKAIQARMPELPIKDTKFGKALSPYPGYKDGDQGHNYEIPELYAIHPYKLITASSPEDRKQLGANAYRSLPGFQQTATGWSQLSTIAATLGMMDELRVQLLQRRIRSIDPRARFPAFWNEHYDWMPDQCHGGNLVATCQQMVMQTNDKEIALFPSVFKEWDAKIKLHAPYNTVVEAKLVNGEIRDLKVTPQSRAKDVKILAGK